MIFVSKPKEFMMNKMSRETVASLLIQPEGRKTFMLQPSWFGFCSLVGMIVWIIENLFGKRSDPLGVLVTSTGKHDLSRSISDFWTEMKNRNKSDNAIF